MGGLGLLRDAWWGRLLVAAVSFLLLPVVPLGTALGAFGLWVLFRAGAPKAAGPHRPWRWGLWLCMVGVAAGFLVVLSAGFRLSGDPAPAGLDQAFYPALAILLLCLGLGASAMAGQVRERAGLREVRRSAERQHADWRAEHARRIASLAADPVRAPYAERLKTGEGWSDEQIDYDLHPERLTTCDHLQPIEQAMRESGVGVKLYSAGYIRAECRIDLPALEARFAPPPCLHYREYFESERGGAPDFPMAHIACAEHPSAITTVHPLEAKSGTPTFPPDASQ